MLFSLLTRFQFVRPVDRVAVRYLGRSIISRHVTREAGVPYVPTLLLRAIGRATGDLRDTALFYFRDGEDYLVVGSRGGAPRHPQWVLNLRANPQAWVWIDRKRVSVRAQFSEGEERARLWESVTKRWPAFVDYQDRARPREIPVIVLRPMRPAG